jgi:hypothetical protein
VLLVLLLSLIWKDGSVLGSNVDGSSVVVIVVDGSSDGSRDVVVLMMMIIHC